MTEPWNCDEELAGLAEALVPPTWLDGPIHPLTPAEEAWRRAWLEREARSGREHYGIRGALGPGTAVSVIEGDVIVREYIGIDPEDA